MHGERYQWELLCSNCTVTEQLPQLLHRNKKSSTMIPNFALVSAEELILNIPQNEVMLEAQTAYTTKTVSPRVPSTNPLCKLQKRKKLHRTPYAFRKRGHTRVTYNGKPLVISPNTAICNLVEL